MNRFGRLTLRVGAGTFFGLIVAYLLFSRVGASHFANILEHIRPEWIATSFILYGLSMLIRAYRWQQMLIAADVALPSLFCVTSLHNLLNHLLPARTGEFSYVYLLKKKHAVAWSQGVATLIMARVIDVAAMGLFFTCAVLYYWSRIRTSAVHVAALGLFCVPVLLVLLLAVLSGRRVMPVCEAIVAWRIGGETLARRLSGFLMRLCEQLHDIRVSGRFKTYAGLTLLTWAVKFAAFFAVSRNFVQPPLTFGETILGTTFSELASTLPVYGVAGIGNIEGGWTLGFVLLGFSATEVIAGAFCFHFFLLCFASVFGVAGLIFVNKS